MKPNELKAALQIKGLEWEAAMETGRSHRDLLTIYKEIKELQYRLLVAEMEEKEKDPDASI